MLVEPEVPTLLLHSLARFQSRTVCLHVSFDINQVAYCTTERQLEALTGLLGGAGGAGGANPLAGKSTCFSCSPLRQTYPPILRLTIPKYLESLTSTGLLGGAAGAGGATPAAGAGADPLAGLAGALPIKSSAYLPYVMNSLDRT